MRAAALIGPHNALLTQLTILDKPSLQLLTEALLIFAPSFPAIFFPSLTNHMMIHPNLSDHHQPPPRKREVN